MEYVDETVWGDSKAIQKFIVFDNNAYGDLTAGVLLSDLPHIIGGLVKEERANGCQALASPYVMLELVALLARPEEKAYKRSVANIAALVRHCTVSPPNAPPSFGIFEDMESQMCRILYDSIPAKTTIAVDHVANLCRTVAARPEHVVPQAGFTWAEQSVRSIENDFVSDLWNYVVLESNPEAQDWNPLARNQDLRAEALEYIQSTEAELAFGRMYALKASRMANKPDSSDGITDKARWIADTFQIPIRLYQEVVRRIYASGRNMTKRSRANTVWDLYIAFSIGAQHSIHGREIRLVTGDKEILEAAGAVGMRSLVYTYPEYRQALSKSDL